MHVDDVSDVSDVGSKLRASWVKITGKDVFPGQQGNQLLSVGLCVVAVAVVHHHMGGVGMLG